MILTRLNECWAERKLSLCAVDPITLTGLALGGLGATAASSLMGGGGGTAPPSQPTPPPAAAPPPSTPQGSAKAVKSQQPTFIGAAATPPNAGSGQKTLLGQ